MIHISTLDIDTNDKFTTHRIMLKIIQCKLLDSMEMKFSSNKGIHVILKCKVECDICRFCYDDIKRFALDQKRPKWARNILFDKKEYGVLNK